VAASPTHALHQRYQQGWLFPYQVSACCDIAAPAELVWDILLDFSRYGDWNAFAPKVETDLQIGSPVVMQVHMPGRAARQQTEILNLLQPGKTICWGMIMGHPLILCANRWQLLHRLDKGGTRYETVDKLSGLLAPLVWLLYGKPMRLGFEVVANSLKQRAEALFDHQGI